MAHIKCRYRVQYCNHDMIGCGGTKCPINLEIEDYIDCPYMAPKKVGDWDRVINPPCVWVSHETLEFEKDYKTYELDNDSFFLGTRRRIDRKDIVYCEIDGRVLFDDTEQTDCAWK